MRQVFAVLALVVITGCSSSTSDGKPEMETEPRVDVAKENSELDLSTAQSAALEFCRACLDADSETAHRILIDDEAQRGFLDDTLKWTMSLRRLESAAIEMFGEAGRQVTGYPSLSKEELEKELHVYVVKDHATASVPGGLAPMELRLIEGRWRVDMSKAMLEDRRLGLLEAARKATKVAEDVAAEIKAGAFKDAQSAKTAFRKRRLDAVKKK